MMHVIYFNTKGGCGKSTLCEYTSKELQRLGYSVSVDNTDQQKHVTQIDNDSADFCLYDTAGAFTGANVELLKAASNENVIVILPLGTGLNDFEEMQFLSEQINNFNLLSRSVVVFTKTRNNSRSLFARKKEVAGLGFKVAKWAMPNLEDFGLKRETTRTRNEISNFIHEVLL